MPITQTFLIGDKKLSYEIPNKWSINKIKCLLCTEFPALKFDYFQIMVNGTILKGNTVIGYLLQRQPNCVMIVVQGRKSQVSLQQYYSQVMDGYINNNCTQQNLPVMHKSYQKCMALIDQSPKQQKQILDLQQPQIFLIQNQVQIFNVFKILRYMGWVLFISIVLTRGYWVQISFIATVIVSHHFIQHLMKMYGKQKIKNNQQIQEQKKGENAQKMKIKKLQNKLLKSILAQILLRVYKTIEILFCIALTLFPNSDLNLHFLMNSERIGRWRAQINMLRPGLFTTKWTIK